MNAMERKALEWVRHTDGTAGKAQFLVDHRPVGEAVWDEIDRQGWIRVSQVSGNVYLSPEGREALKVLR